MDSFLFEKYADIKVADLKNLNPKDYIYEMAQVLKLGLIRDASFYEWSILNFQEIMEMDEDSLQNIIDKVRFIMMYFESKDPQKVKEYNFLYFGDIFTQCLINVLGDSLDSKLSLSLGMIVSSYISYKREMLSMEEYYEIRDMFVPFNMPISLDAYDVDRVLDEFKKLTGTVEYIDNFVLLKKIGKAVFTNQVKISEIEEAFKQLIVEWD